MEHSGTAPPSVAGENPKPLPMKVRRSEVCFDRHVCQQNDAARILQEVAVACENCVTSFGTDPCTFQYVTRAFSGLRCGAVDMPWYRFSICREVEKLGAMPLAGSGENGTRINFPSAICMTRQPHLVTAWPHLVAIFRHGSGSWLQFPGSGTYRHMHNMYLNLHMTLYTYIYIYIDLNTHVYMYQYSAHK